MKRISFIFVIVLFVMLAGISCKKQQDNPPEPLFDTLMVNSTNMYYDMTENTILTMDAYRPDATSYLWMPGNLTTSSITIRDEGYYVVEINTPSQLFTYQVLVVYNGSDCFIPNSFSPNDDGLNDIWRPYFYNINTENYSLEIFDNDNLKLFSTDNLLKGWDGKYHATPMPAGYYYYVVYYKTASAQIKNRNGMLQLVL